MTRPLAPTLLPALLLAMACGSGDGDRDGGEAAATLDGQPTPAPTLGPADGHDLPGVALERVAVGDPAPDFSLASYDDGVVTLSDYRGSKNVVLAFYRGHW